ncbi:MAG: 5'-nucleotidase C-terminal domain-containing protein, partial [Pseudomonadota bacterium]
GIADLYPFPNTLVGLRVRGEQLIEWLERAVSCFCQVYSEQNRQPLWNPDFVGNTFDTVCGLRYAINLAQPARYDKTGALINPNAHRINNLRHQGQPIKDTDEFVLALKSFRAFSSGMFAVPEAADLIYRGQTPIRDLLIGYIRQNGCENVVPSHPSWAFQPVENASVVLETGPGVMAYMNDIEDISGKVIDQTDRGFMRLEIPLK